MSKIIEDLAENVDINDKVFAKPGESYIIYNDDTAKKIKKRLENPN